MLVKNAAYIVSSPNYQKCPEADRPEYAFIGRSNVGKSSLINKLTNKKKLAKTSSTPGKTIMINHYAINDKQMYWVDLPGYGYAKRSKKMVRQLENMIYSYLKNRQNLLTTFVLLDSRHEPQEIDLKFIAWFGANQIPIALVFTKADKKARQQIENNIVLFQQELSKQWEELPLMFLTSAHTGEGLDELQEYIKEANKYYKS